jgi:hypothetical protein
MKENAYTQKPQIVQQFMQNTHQYYNSQNFVSKDTSEQGSPEAAVSVCLEDSFCDMIDNDTSERHILVQRTPKGKMNGYKGAPL